MRISRILVGDGLRSWLQLEKLTPLSTGQSFLLRESWLQCKTCYQYHKEMFVYGVRYICLFLPNALQFTACISLNDPLDLAELHSFRLVYFKHKEIFFVVCILSSSKVWS